MFLSCDFSSSLVSEINSETQAYAQRGSRLKGIWISLETLMEF